MSQEKFLNNLDEINIDITWCHWNRLGVTGPGKLNQCSTDPEALILLTSIAGKKDLRLVDGMMTWLHHYESLISIERLKSYVRELLSKKTTTHENFTILQNTIAELNSKRWDSVSKLFNNNPSHSSSSDKSHESRKKLEAHNTIIRKNLQLFLRRMFGVGTRADIIYYSMVVSEQQKNPFNLFISAPQMAEALHYNHSSIHRTLYDLDQAGILTVDSRKIGKNKIFHLNPDIMNIDQGRGHKPLRDKYYIDWFKIVEIFIQSEQFKKQIQNTMDDSIKKSRLNGFLKSCSVLTAEAFIDVKNSLMNTQALKHVGFDKLEADILSSVQGIYEFVT